MSRSYFLIMDPGTIWLLRLPTNIASEEICLSILYKKRKKGTVNLEVSQIKAQVLFHMARPWPVAGCATEGRGRESWGNGSASLTEYE